MKEVFIDDEIWILTFGGGFQRGNIYEKTASDNSRKELRNYIKEYIRNLVKHHYTSNIVTDEDHEDNIVKFCSTVSKRYGDILNNKKFRIGIGQKILNLYLKYLWCLGKITKPPHCPFDRIIISKIGSNISFTKMDSIEDYKKLVKLAKQKAGNKSIAEWELKIFNRR